MSACIMRKTELNRQVSKMSNQINRYTYKLTLRRKWTPEKHNKVKQVAPIFLLLENKDTGHTTNTSHHAFN